MTTKDYLKVQLSELMEKKNLDFVNQFFIQGKDFDKNLYHEWYFLAIAFLEEIKSPKIEEFIYYYEKKDKGIYSVILNNSVITKDSKNLFELYIDWYNEAYKYLNKYYTNGTDSFSKYFFNSDKLKEQSSQKYIDLSELLMITTKQSNQLSEKSSQQMTFLLETQYQHILTYKEIIENNKLELEKIGKEMRKSNSRKVTNKGIDY